MVISVPLCPNCGVLMTASDSGEPECISGWFCPECLEFYSDDELAAIGYEEENRE